MCSQGSIYACIAINTLAHKPSCIYIYICIYIYMQWETQFIMHKPLAVQKAILSMNSTYN